MKRGVTVAFVAAPLVLPETARARRRPPRPWWARQWGYLRNFDARTLICEAFHCAEEIRIVAPPPANLRELFDATTVDGLAAKPIEFSTLDQAATATLPLRKPDAREIRIAGEDFDLTAPIASDEAARFAGKRVLLVKSRNNPIEWIVDWLRYHIELHGADALLFYDNLSSHYGLERLAEAIGRAGGLKEAVIVSWPFRFGPGGGPLDRWDSDFAQFCLLEHARWRFLREAAAVLAVDIDELVDVTGPRTVFDQALDSPTGGVLLGGYWIAGARGPGTAAADGIPRFHDFPYSYRPARPCEPKWCAAPQRLPPDCQWTVHRINDTDLLPAHGAFIRHFRGMSTGWKRDPRGRPFDPAIHQRDDALVAQLHRLLPDPSPPHQIEGPTAAGDKRGISSRDRFGKPRMGLRRLAWRAWRLSRAR